jgi:hypothetical protein
MTFNPSSKTDVSRLRRAIEWSRRKLQPFRRTREKLIREFVGSEYGQDGAVRDVPLNLLERAVVIYTMLLAGSRPQVLILTEDDAQKQFARDFQTVLNKELRIMRVGEVLRAIVMDAFFMIGLAKVSMKLSDDVEIIDGVPQSTAIPNVGVVDLDDWVHDMTVNRWHDLEFAGDRYRVPFDFFKESGLYDRKAIKDLKPTDETAFNETGDRRIETLGIGADGRRDDFRPFIELWDIWIADEKLVVTLPIDQGEEPVRVVEWDGPSQGPYYKLSFWDVPNRIMPSSPAQQLKALHDLENNLVRKMRRQGQRQKTVLAYAGDDQDPRSIENADDGQVIRVNDPSAVQEFRLGGVDQGTQQFAMWVENRFDIQAGNLSTLGGLSSGAETLGQEQILSGQASQRVAKMQERTVMFTEQIIRDLGWRIWDDPVRTFTGKHQVKDLDIEERVIMRPEDREGDFLNYEFTVEPYSMTYQSPSQRLSQLQQFVTQFVPPLFPFFQEQGIQLNMKRLVEIWSEYANLPELTEVVELGSPTPQVESNDRARQAPVTTRINERVNRGGSSQKNFDQQLMSSLASGDRNNGVNVP